MEGPPCSQAQSCWTCLSWHPYDQSAADCDSGCTPLPRVASVRDRQAARQRDTERGRETETGREAQRGSQRWRRARTCRMVVGEAHAGGSQRIQPRGERAVGLGITGGLLVEAVGSGAGHSALP